jgi:hypothetical protein
LRKDWTRNTRDTKGEQFSWFTNIDKAKSNAMEDGVPK